MTEPLFAPLHAALAHALPQWGSVWSGHQFAANYINWQELPALYRLLTCAHEYPLWATELQVKAHSLKPQHPGVVVFGVQQIPDTLHKRYVIPVHIRTLYPIVEDLPHDMIRVSCRQGLDRMCLGQLIQAEVPLTGESMALRMLVSNVTDVYAAKVRLMRRNLIEELASAFVAYEYGLEPVILHEAALQEAADTIAGANPVSVAHDILSAVQIQNRVHELLDWQA